MDRTEQLIELLVAVALPRPDHRPGELDRSRTKILAGWERLASAGTLDESIVKEMTEKFDASLDYQRDHPLGEIDETLDKAMDLASQLAARTLADGASECCAELAPQDVGRVIREFGRRSEVTLQAFGWAVTPDRWIVLAQD